MKLQTGYIYHIKDEFFNIMDDKNLMMNHERGRKRRSEERRVGKECRL